MEEGAIVGWFSKKCPMPYWKLDKSQCPLCPSWRDNKCHYKEDEGQALSKSMRGYPVLIKKSVMNKPKEARRQFEQAALKYSGFNSKEQQEYWSISLAYDTFWDEAKPDQRDGILGCLDHWRLFLEDGLSPLEANEKVEEWLKEQYQMMTPNVCRVFRS